MLDLLIENQARMQLRYKKELDASKARKPNVFEGEFTLRKRPEKM